MEATTFSDPGVIDLLGEGFVPVRVDADRLPHVADRYTVGGWPTVAFLTPGGEVLWAGNALDPDEFRRIASGVLAAWTERRAELEHEIALRHKALQAARSRRGRAGLVRREAAAAVMTALHQRFDARNGGFGESPKYPHPEALETLLVEGQRKGDTDCLLVAERTLDGMLAGELMDRVGGGFYRMARGGDWTDPEPQKLLKVNAGMLRAYALGHRVIGRPDWLEVAERTVAWAETCLRRADGLWSAAEIRLAPDVGRPGAGAGGEGSWIDDVVYTDRNARWLRALADAGGRLGKDAWIEEAASGLDRLLDLMSAPDDRLHHYRANDDSPALPGLLVDLVHTALACVAVAQATGQRVYLEQARRLASTMRRDLWSDEGFRDHDASVEVVAALTHPHCPFDLNADATSLFIDLALATGDRGYRAAAERALATLAPLAGRYGVAGAAFARATEEFFRPPLRVVTVGSIEETASLRRAALLATRCDRRVWHLEAGGRIGTWSFPVDNGVAAYICDGSRTSAAVRAVDQLGSALAAVVR